MNATTLSAKDIVDLLAAKHSGDVFVPECKDGPTVGSSHNRLDAWAMARSWTQPCITGYEVKVSRSDFLRDDKWSQYLTMCNRLYFVCPHRLIDPSELPGEVGLMWVSKNGNRLFVKSKPDHRKLSGNDLEMVFRYILICRSMITRERLETDTMDYWKSWLNDRKERRRTGHEVARQISRMAGERIEEIRAENQALKNENYNLRQIKEYLEKEGVNPVSWHSLNDVRRRIRLEVGSDLETASRELREVADRLDRKRESVRAELEAAS